MNISRRSFIASTAAFAGVGFLNNIMAAGKDTKKPNIIILYADDLGYGDIGCYGAKLARTPNLDKLASNGIRFTDAHSTSPVCTPSRYAILTGEYPWRRKVADGILFSDSPLTLRTDRATVASILKKAGYTTACIGKWHLGLGKDKPDWNAELKPGPNDLGFDYSFIIPTTGDRVPCVYVENQKVVNFDPADPITISRSKIGNEPTGKENPELLKVKHSMGHDGTIVNGIGRIGFMTGGKKARWVDEDMSDTITGKATDFITNNKDNPFFMYFATQDIHVPRAPHDRFKGRSGMGIRGDIIEQMDAAYGTIMKKLEELGLAENTLIVFSSDNGPVIDDGYQDGSPKDCKDHDASGPLSGGKYSFLEGGHRVPFIASWPAKIKPGTSDSLICQIDLLAAFASITGQKIPADSAADSLDISPALLGSKNPVRENLVLSQGQHLALRKGKWKYIPGGKKGEQLFDLSNDIAESKNLAETNSDKLEEMKKLLGEIRKSEYTRPR